jgi:hypothetical protein
MFNAELFGRRLMPEYRRQRDLQPMESCAATMVAAEGEEGRNVLIDARFAVAGVDIMVDEKGEFKLLEVNANPAAPPSDVIDDEFREHLLGFAAQLTRLVLSKGEDLGLGGGEEMQSTPPGRGHFIRACDLLPSEEI